MICFSMGKEFGVLVKLSNASIADLKKWNFRREELGGGGVRSLMQAKKVEVRRGRRCG